MLRLLAAVALLVLTTGLVLAGPNVYPDPSFEANGIAGTARTGERAAYLAVKALNHWAAFGGAIEVEPFARYKVTEWARARVGKGTFYAPYCYGWDSYEWAFCASCPAPVGDEWKQVSLTFVTPDTKMWVHPLGYIEAADSEGWADDIVVEKIAEPEQVMAEIAAKTNRSVDETRLLGRWLVLHNDMAGAAKLMEQAEGELRADLATVIARAVKDTEQRRPYVVQVVAHGGPTYHDGLKVFNEITQDMAAYRAGIAIEALKLNPKEARVGRAAQMVLSAAPTTDPLASVADGLANLKQSRAALQAAVDALPADSPARTELQKAAAALAEQEAAMQKQASELGNCVIRLGGKPLYPSQAVIVLPARPTPQESYAAADLRHHLELITGQLFRIVNVGAGQPGFYVGKTQEAIFRGIRFDKLGLEGLQIRTDGQKVILAGNQRGVLYAVYTFLEDYLGCRWFTPDCSTWPRTGTIDIPKLNRTYIPPLEFRAGDYPCARPGDFGVRCRLNGNNHQMSVEQGGRKGVHSLAHTFQSLCPPEKYFATHPEYFSLVNGKRQSGYAQLCLTNPEVLKICIAGVRQWIKDHPDMKVFSVSQNDTHYPCDCENCRRVVEEEGSQAGPVVRFCNAIADDIKDDYPDVAIETLAYQYTRKPPKLTKPRPNVIICLCSIECCFIHPLGDDPFNKTFADDIRGWNKICDRLWIWDYVINYAHSICPFPNLEVLKPNINFFIKNGVKGIYEESCYYTKASELQELRNYVIAKTLWDPTYDTQKAISEFCAAYYGPAAPQVIAYLKLIHRSVQQVPNLHVQIYTHPKVFVFPDVISQSNALFDQAEAAVANDPVLLQRVQVARLPIMYAQIVLGTSGSFVEKDGKLVQTEGQDVGSLLDRFAQIGHAAGVTKVREGGDQSGLDAWLASVPRQPRELRVVTIRNQQLQADLLPALGGRIWRLTYLPDQRALIRVAGTPQALSPAEGGYEEYSQGGYRSAGWNENYMVSAKTDRSVTLKAVLRNTLALARKIELAPDGATLTITSTLSNGGSQPQQACLRSHPEFAVSSTENCSVRVLRADGKTETIKLANPADPKAERDQWLRDDDLPAGQWELVDTGSGLTIINRFERDDVAQALLNRAGHQGRVNLELFGREVTLKPQESVQLRQSFEVRK
jgi:hypothetical protein